MRNNIILLLVFLSFFIFTSAWAEVERRQIICAVLDKIEGSVITQRSYADIDCQKIESLQLSPSRNFLSDFYLSTPLQSLQALTLISNPASSFFPDYYKFNDFLVGEEKFKVGTKIWFTTEALKWVTSSPANATRSKLTYPHTGIIYLLNTEYTILPWVSIDCNGALGQNDGIGEDVDWWLFPLEFSKTTHDSDSRLYFYETNLYFRPIALKDWELELPNSFTARLNEFKLDLFAGYHFHKASYKMTTGQRQTAWWMPAQGGFSLDSSYKIIHKGCRVGLRSIFGNSSDLSLEIRVAYLPYVKTKGIGWWNNRILNFIQKSDEGHGVDGEFCVNYSPKQIPGLSLGVGFRYLRLVAKDGISHSDEEGLAPWEVNWDLAKSAFKGPFINASYQW